MYIYATLCIGANYNSRVAPIAARIPSSNAGERGPRANAECGNWGNVIRNVTGKSEGKKHYETQKKRWP